MRQIRQPQHQLVPGRLRLRRLFIQRRDPVAQVAGFLLLGLGLGEFLLAHERADLLGHALALGLERFDLAQQLAPQLVAREHLVNAGLIPCPARRQALAHEIRLFANQFDVEHRRIIFRVRAAASAELRFRLGLMRRPQVRPQPATPHPSALPVHRVEAAIYSGARGMLGFSECDGQGEEGFPPRPTKQVQGKGQGLVARAYKGQIREVQGTNTLAIPEQYRSNTLPARLRHRDCPGSPKRAHGESDLPPRAPQLSATQDSQTPQFCLFSRGQNKGTAETR